MDELTTTIASRRQPVGPSPVSQDRRTRRRLRALCDEVLASYRVASQREIISDVERQEAAAFLARLTPRVA